MGICALYPGKITCKYPCSINQPFLENNEDFFIALFSDTKHDDACIRLYKHMNDCYPCFEIFSQVLRDYYRQENR